MLRKEIITAAISLILFACVPVEPILDPTATLSPPTHTPFPSATMEVILPSSTPTIEPVESIPEYSINTFPYSRYFMRVNLQYLAHTAQVNQTISFSNYTGTPLDSIPLTLPAQRIPDVVKFSSLTWGDGTPITGYQLRQGILTINLDEALQPDETILFMLEYHLNLPTLTGTFGFTENQILMDNWYPSVPPYEPDKGWVINAPPVYGEYLAYPLSSFEVMISVDDPDVLVAAPGESSNGNGGDHFLLPSARRFAFAASPEFVKQTDSIDKFTVEFYTFPDHAPYSHLVIQPCLEALDLFTRQFGDPGTDRVVVIESQIPDGLESDGLFFLGEEYFFYEIDPPKDWLTIISVHEISHLWWYSLMGTDPANHPWLDEALATYSEYLYLEALHPDAIDWWWDFRINQAKFNYPLSSTVYAFDDRWEYIRSVYLQGVKFFHDLRGELGDDEFFQFLRSLIEVNPEGLISPDQFFDLLNPSPQIEESIRQYFPDHP